MSGKEDFANLKVTVSQTNRQLVAVEAIALDVKQVSGHVARVSNITQSLVTGPLIAVWAVTGPIFHYSENWQLVINTGTTIITFLMVFLIQNTQNRDGSAVQTKLDELIRVSETARNKLLNLEDMTEEFRAICDQVLGLLFHGDDE